MTDATEALGAPRPISDLSRDELEKLLASHRESWRDSYFQVSPGWEWADRALIAFETGALAATRPVAKEVKDYPMPNKQTGLLMVMLARSELRRGVISEETWRQVEDHYIATFGGSAP